MRLLKIDFKEKRLISAEDLDDGQKVPTEDQLDEKPAFFNKLLANEIVLVSIDSTVEKVQLPAALTANRITALKWSRKYNIPDFVFDNTALSGTLQFAQGASFVFIPWASVIRIEGTTSGESRFWPDQVS